MLPMNPDQIFSKLRERIYGFAASQVSKEWAEDLAQDVLLLLHEKYGHVIRMEELVPLAFQILRFKMWEGRRKSWRRGEHAHLPLEEIQARDPRDDPGALAERKEMLERLTRAVEGLGGRFRLLFLWNLEGRGFKEIQRLFGVDSINTIYTWDFRCRKQLIAKMGGVWE
jgi:RNA polymerase sigma-70 factor (ECF subfamily)